MSWFWAIIFLSFAFSDEFITEAKHQKKLPSAVIVGTVYCDTCFHQDFSKANNHFLSGASVAVECKDNTSSPATNFRKEVKTNKHGEFQVHLPVPISKHINKIKSCSIQLIRSNEPLCAIAATATSSNLRLKSRKRGTHIFSAGFFTFKPLNQPEVCDQKQVVQNPRKPEKLSPIDNPNDPTFYPPLQDPKSNPPTLGGILPLPELPLLPRLPPIPLLPQDDKNEKSLEDSKVNEPTPFQFLPNPFFPVPLPPNPLNPPLIPPNPLLPPPSLLPPNPLMPPPSLIPPLIPSPPPSLFPPILPTPPAPPSLPIPLPPVPGLPPLPVPPLPSLPPLPVPPVPGFTPPPLPRAPPAFPIPFPPFPFQPAPGLPGPGVPPAVASSESKKSSP